MSIFAVFPHIHLIGTKMKSFAVTPSNDTIPLVNINHWDFEWQGFYTYKNMIKIPKGSVLYGTATYDNTSNNHHNPFNPPQIIYAGEETTDEMLLISYQSLKYEEGDENYDLEELLPLPNNMDTSADYTSIHENSFVTPIRITAYPNPTTGYFEISGWSASSDYDKTQVTVTDVFGKTVFTTEVNMQDKHVRVNLNKSDGIYLVTLKCGDRFASQKIVLMR